MKTQHLFQFRKEIYNEYEKKIRNDNISDISNEKLEHTINSITITGDKAIAKCYEYYEYTYKNDPIRSSRGTEYQITLIKNYKIR